VPLDPYLDPKIRIRIQEGKSDKQKWKKVKILVFEVLDVLFLLKAEDL
jgi:hypothetical protein